MFTRLSTGSASLLRYLTTGAYCNGTVFLSLVAGSLIHYSETLCRSREGRILYFHEQLLLRATLYDKKKFTVKTLRGSIEFHFSNCIAIDHCVNTIKICHTLNTQLLNAYFPVAGRYRYVERTRLYITFLIQIIILM